MAAQPNIRRFTVAEYYQMGEVGILGPEDRTELIDGEIIVMSPIGTPHAWCVAYYNRSLSRKLGDRAEVIIQNPIHLDDHSEPLPDILVLRPGHYSRQEHPTAADVLLLIEVSDTTLRFDRHTKVPRYARSGVPEVWVTNLGGETIHAFRDPTPSGVYATTFVRHRGERIAPAAFPDLDLSVDEILG